MATLVTPINTSKLLIAIGNGLSPESFNHKCMINTSRGISFSGTPTETVIPNCPPDEDEPAWIDRELDTLSATITGAGVFDSSPTSGIELWSDWFILAEVKNVRVMVSDKGYWRGVFILTSFSVTGSGRREKVQFECTLMSDGEIRWVPTT